jgi:hypothetical protein
MRRPRQRKGYFVTVAKSAIKRPRPARKSQGASVALVTGILEGYAAKAVFRGFSAHPETKGRATYRMVWHHDRPFEMLLDIGEKTLQFPEVLPGVPARSPMYRELQAFLKERQSGALPEHRSVNPAKARLASGNKRGTVSITLTVKDGDFDYATRKIIHIVHEIFLIFLVDGPYFEYMVEHLGLDEDRY